VEASQGVELTGTNRPCGLTTNRKPAARRAGEAATGYRSRRRSVVGIEGCQAIRLQISLLIQLSEKVAPPLVAAAPKVSGRHSEGATPVPIPNTAVKPLGADGTVPDGGTGE
jgi:hypothetical protein